MICTLCSSKKIEALRAFKSPYIEKDYTLYSCADCDSLFFDVEEHALDIQRFYEDYGGQNQEQKQDRLGFQFSSYWGHQVRLIRKLHDAEIDSVLDVGCRNGDFLLHWPDGIMRMGIERSKDPANITTDRKAHV